MYDIELADEQTFVEIDQEFLLEITRRTLADEQVLSAEISIALVDNPSIFGS